MSLKFRVIRSVALVAGAGFLGAAAWLYPDILELTDRLSVSDGAVTVRIPWIVGAEPFRTPIRVDDLWAAVPLVAALVALVGVLFLAALGRGRLMTFGRGLRRWPRGAQGAVAAAATAAVVTAFLPAGEEARLAVYFALGTLGFALLLWGAGGRALGWMGAGVTAVGRRLAAADGWWMAGVSAATLVLGAALTSTLVFRHLPHVVDGVSYLFQARIFASGAVFLPSPPLPEFFHVDTIVNNGRWFSQYPPGHTLALLVGLLAGVPWLVNPILGGGFVLALYALGRVMFGEGVARLSVLLAVLSPFVVLISSEYYNHASALLWATLFLLGHVRFMEGGKPRTILVAGAALGMCVLTRPLTAVAVAVPVAVDGLLHLGHLRQRHRWVWAALGAGVTLGFTALLLAYNAATTGDPLVFGYQLAEGPGAGMGDGILPLRTLGRLQLLNDASFAWPVPGLLLLTAAFLGGRPSRWDYLLAGVIAALMALHLSVGYRDAEFGPRYLYEGMGAVALLTARGLHAVPQILERFGTGVKRGNGREVAYGGIALAFGISLALFWPPRWAFYGSETWQWAVRDDVVAAVREAGLDQGVVFVEIPDELYGKRLWESTVLQNPVPLASGPLIFALDLGERNEELMAYIRGPYYRFRDGLLVPLE